MNTGRMRIPEYWCCNTADWMGNKWPLIASGLV